MKVEMSFHNHYYPWTEIKANDITCWLKGTFFYENELLRGDDVVRLFSSVLEGSRVDHEALKALLLALNGNFALTMESPGCIFCAVDRVRSTPLFYAVSGSEALFSDDANHLRDRLNPPFNEENGAEFLVTGYVTGPDTLFDGISQILAGEYLVYNKRDGALATHFYHRFWHGNYFSDSDEELLDQLDEVFVRVFERLIESTKGRQIVVPLSGGLDSRIIVAMLKRLGVEGVICFTYGKKGNREAEISRQVAEALGYQWHFVEYTNEKWYACAYADDMKAYYSYAGNLVSIPHIQDYLAVKELKGEGKIPENVVFVPGHSGDMLAGSWIPQDYDQPQAYTFEKFLEDSLKKHYRLWKWDEAELGSLFEGKIGKSVEDISVHNNESCANVIELFNFNERQAKFIVNSVRVYEFFGFQWRIPLWDAELIDFFLRVPLMLRLKQVLYREYAMNKLFIGPLETLRNLDSTANLKVGSKHYARNGFISNIKSSLKELPLLGKLGKNVYTFRRIHTEYDTHPLAWYGILPKDRFLKIYSGAEHVNSFVGLSYINRLCPASLSGAVKRYFKNADQVLSAL
ncbi:asparagine synthetase B family protein [Methanoculleus formosensis]|nr:asparagine synthetase B family protein [Methanoculleus sp. Afa-1]